MPQQPPFVHRAVLFERVLRDRAARAPGPYEAAYDVRRGYEAPAPAPPPKEPPAGPVLLAGPRARRR